MHDTVLMILSVRNIQSVVDCNLNLPCEKIWFKGYKEYELAPIINDFVNNSNFKYYFITSDDALIKKENFINLQHHLHYHNIVSGWCLYRQNANHTTIVKPNNFHNLIFKPNFTTNTFVNNILHHTYKTHQVNALPDIIESAFTGWCYTGMHKHIWQQYPFQTLQWPYSSSDLLFSHRVFSDKKYKQYIIKQAHAIHLSHFYQKSYFDPSQCFNNKEIIKTF
jgi:hypothetical protein